MADRTFSTTVTHAGERREFTIVVTGPGDAPVDAAAVERFMNDYLKPIGLTVETVCPGNLLSEDAVTAPKSYAMVVVVRGVDATEAYETFTSGSHDEVRFVGDPWEVETVDEYDTAKVVGARPVTAWLGPIDTWPAKDRRTLAERLRVALDEDRHMEPTACSRLVVALADEIGLLS